MNSIRYPDITDTFEEKKKNCAVIGIQKIHREIRVLTGEHSFDCSAYFFDALVFLTSAGSFAASVSDSSSPSSCEFSPNRK